VAPKFLLAPNALKGTLSAQAAARAMAEGVRQACPEALIIELPIADGGDGTRDVLSRARRGSSHERTVEDALGRPINAAFALIDGDVGVVDVATASGLARLATEELDPLRASSFGTGQLLSAALAAGARHLVLGAGGSACVDGGTGILEALGARLLDLSGRPIRRGGGGLRELSRIDLERLDRRAAGGAISVACDVETPLLGPTGAARVFAPQKGATPEQVEELERSLAHFAEILEQSFGYDVSRLVYGGAAGGIAAGLAATLGAKLRSGIDLVLDEVEFERELQGTFLVMTAEGRLDSQSASNKGPFGVARRARLANVPTIVLAGQIADDISPRALECFADAFSITRGSITLEQAKTNAGPELRTLSESVARRALEVRFR
jgi:glycerate kinase